MNDHDSVMHDFKEQMMAHLKDTYGITVSGSSDDLADDKYDPESEEIQFEFDEMTVEKALAKKRRYSPEHNLQDALDNNVIKKAYVFTDVIACTPCLSLRVVLITTPPSTKSASKT